jgi:D-alanyl-D-alanine carboxypeptidase/D-alanyl-D-alanine-endopeptidase (penicillin-binding protein 4)
MTLARTHALPKLLVLLLLFLCSASHTNQAVLSEKKPALYSYIMGNIHRDQIDEEHASELYATPASTQKTVTALIALTYLGCDYRYQTTAFATYTDNPPTEDSRSQASCPAHDNSAQNTESGHHNKTIRDIVISFSGDPTLTSKNLLSLLAPFKNSCVKGSIILDASSFKTPIYSPNLMIDCIGSWYCSPISSINIDRNSIKIPGTPHAECASDEQEVEQAEPLSICTSPTGDAAVMAPALEPYISAKIRNILNSLNISFSSIKFVYNQAELPANMVLQNTHYSEPIKQIIPAALKSSDNFIFDSLYLTIIHTHRSATKSGPDINSWNNGNAIYKELIKKHFDIDFESALFVDGSGLSRCNRMQPKKLFLLLKKGFSIPEFVQALPQPGELNSTLAKRTALPHNIRAKTGYIPGFSCLCGYALDDQHPKVFVMMASCFAPPLQDVTDTVDNFLHTKFNNAIQGSSQ